MADNTLLSRIDSLEAEHAEIEARLGDPNVAADNKKYVELTRRYSDLGELVRVGRALRARVDDLEVAKMLVSEATAEEREELRTEANEAEAEIIDLESELKLLLLPKDPMEGRNVIVEIRGAEGGEEANLFARDLYGMYIAYGSKIGWKIETIDSQVSDMGGFATVTFKVSGDDCWTRLKFEAGPHRVQRVPVTESQGRVHTSSATVAVLPEADEVDVSIKTVDLQYDTFRASGAGGQHVNKTDSAVRLTHKPSGLVVSMQDSKSQGVNRQVALEVLRSRLLALELQKAQDEASAARKDQVGGGGRSEKIRTYNFKENRVSDHRIGLTVYNLDRVLAGDLDEVSDALMADERTRQLSESVE